MYRQKSLRKRGEAVYAGGIYAGGAFAGGGPYRTCVEEYQDPRTQKWHCAYYDPPGLKPRRFGTAANQAAAERNPWLLFSQAYRDDHYPRKVTAQEIAMEYRRAKADGVLGQVIQGVRLASNRETKIASYATKRPFVAKRRRAGPVAMPRGPARIAMQEMKGDF